ncbi:MAG: M48 family metalloprotease [Ilumatobacteraceae bacterium]|jgi:Zn-dependent protease with chaperone function|nr:M48 family metalloprotease [Ilumatobacteraceae bacterium]
MATSRSSPRSRHADGSALTALAPVVALLPAWAVTIALLWWITGPFHDISYALFALVAFILGAALFIRPAQQFVLVRLLGARMPRRDERDRLQRAWLVVAQASHVPASQFILAIADGDEVNAFACGGHLMVVSSYAVNELDHDELCGVLAHELSHHLGLHTVALTVSQWLSLPVVLFAQLGFMLQNVADVTANTLRVKSLDVLGRTVAGTLTIISWIFIADLSLARYLSNAAGKGAEFRADRNAVELGFGKQLSRALRRVVDEGRDERPKNWRDRIVTSHPPARTRVARIDAYQRQLQSRR